MESLAFTQGAYLSYGGDPKVARSSPVLVTGSQAFRETWRQSRKKKYKTKEEAIVLSWRAVPSQKPLHCDRGVVESLVFTQNACLPFRGHTKVARNPLGDGDRKPDFQGDFEATWGKKAVRPRRRLGSQMRCAWGFLESLAFTRGVCLPDIVYPKAARNPMGDENRTPGFQGNVEAAQGTKGQGGGWGCAPEGSAFPTATTLGLGGHGVPCFHPECMLSPWGELQRGKKSPRRQ